MALFNRKKKSKPGQAQVAQESVPSPAPQPAATATPATTMAPTTLVMPTQPTAQQPVKGSKKPATRLKKPGGLRTYLEGVGAKKKGLEIALRQQNVKTSLYEHVRCCRSIRHSHSDHGHNIIPVPWPCIAAEPDLRGASRSCGILRIIPDIPEFPDS
jgi:hypothetical protein